jgi:hypothetical protein
MCKCNSGTVNKIKVEVNIDNRDKAETVSTSDPKIDVTPTVKTTVSPKTDTKVTSKAKAKSKSKSKAKSKSKVNADTTASDDGDGENGEGETMTICHETPSGQRNTLTLPIQAALTHLEEHPLDTEGPCEES